MARRNSELAKLKKEDLIQIIVNTDRELLDEVKSMKNLLAKTCEELQVQKREINELKKVVKEKDDRLDRLGKQQDTCIRQLEIKTNILEQRSKKSNAVIFGLELRSFADVVSGAGRDHTPRGPNDHTLLSDEHKVAGLLNFANKTLKHKINTVNVTAVYQLKNQRVLVKFATVGEKLSMMAARKTIARTSDRDTIPYINDQMTYTGSTLLRECRDLKKKGLFKFVWTRLGKIFVKKADESRTQEIQCSEDIEKCVNN